MTRLFLASALVVTGVMQLIPDPAPTPAFPALASELFGIEDLDAGAATAAGFLEIGPGGELLFGAEWEPEVLDSWVFEQGAEGQRPFQPAQRIWLAKRGADPMDFESSLNGELIRLGLATGHVAADGHVAAGRASALGEAAGIAQAAGAGRWSVGQLAPRPAFRPDPNNPGAWLGAISGVALPMHHKEAHQTYAWELAEIADLGASWVNLIVATRMERVDSVLVPLTSERTPSDERIRATIELAHDLGLRVQLMPIVLLKDPGESDWRGTLAPKDMGQFWRCYDRFIGHMADLASASSAEVLCVGSEFASLESDQDAWLRIIANLRMRYRGQLTYSANWDHFARVPFWSKLDFASMTAYFTLCEEATGAATADLGACVEAGWRAGLFEAWRLSNIAKLPVVFSEVGVPSVQGALAGPWDYTLDAPVDVEAQRLAFESFHQVLLPGGELAEGFHGAFLYDYWGEGGPASKTYTPRGKPALVQWRRILGDLSAAGE